MCLNDFFKKAHTHVFPFPAIKLSSEINVARSLVKSTFEGSCWTSQSNKSPTAQRPTSTILLASHCGLFYGHKHYIDGEGLFPYFRQLYEQSMTELVTRQQR